MFYLSQLLFSWHLQSLQEEQIPVFSIKAQVSENNFIHNELQVTI